MSNMTVEILYKDLTNIYGDIGNIKLLEKSLPKAKFVYTTVNEKPYFVSHKVDMIYMGSMPEEYEDIILKALNKYTDKLKELIEKGTVVLFTGTAFELSGKYVEEHGKKKKTLDIIDDIYFKKDKDKRHNSLFVGEFNDIKIVGNKSQFSYMYGKNKHPFIKANENCMGMNPDRKDEGVHYKNFFGIQVLGPVLVLNPLLFRYILDILKVKDKFYLEDLLVEAYNKRVTELLKPGKRYILKDHG